MGWVFGNLAFMSYFVIKVSFRIIFVLSTSLVARSNKNEIVLSSKIEINFTHADVEWLMEILNSVVTTCSLKIS